MLCSRMTGFSLDTCLVQPLLVYLTKTHYSQEADGGFKYYQSTVMGYSGMLPHSLSEQFLKSGAPQPQAGVCLVS